MKSTRVYFIMMKVDFHSHGSQRQSAKQQKPGCRWTRTVGANRNPCWLKASSCRSARLTEHQAEALHYHNLRKWICTLCIYHVEWNRTNSGVKGVEMTVLLLGNEGLCGVSAKSLTIVPNRFFFLEMAV